MAFKAVEVGALFMTGAKASAEAKKAATIAARANMVKILRICL